MGGEEECLCKSGGREKDKDVDVKSKGEMIGRECWGNKDISSGFLSLRRG